MKNIQCECGLCCGTYEDWSAHRQATSHEHYEEVTIEKLTKQAIKAIKGLETFQKYTSEDCKLTDEDYTSIRIRKDTKAKLEKKGKFGESQSRY